MSELEISRADQTLVIKSSVWKLLWLVVLLGLLLVLAANAIPSMIGWLGTIIMGPLFLIALYIYRPNATFLKLHSKGLEITTAGRKRTVNWSDVIGFHIGKNGRDRSIGILYADDYIARHSTQMSQMPDSDIEWIRDLYVIPLDELCRTLNSWIAGVE
jgi:hypothetical protein